MTREAQTSKNFFQINGGLNTELNELNFADGFTKDEANYELLVDGSRRRRKGLAVEASAGSAKTIDTLGSGYYNQSYLWKNVGGDPDKNVYVFRTGDFIYFADADSVVSDGWYTGAGSNVDTTPYRSDSATDALVQKEPLSFSQGRGHLFVSGPYILPFYISYDASADEFTSNPIQIYIRDYTTIKDGTAVNFEPTGDGDGSLDSIDADHYYNLRNRGWRESDISQYDSDETLYPARNMVWYLGYKRTYGASIAESDGTRSWDSAKLQAEGFGGSSAPVGALLLDPTDTTVGVTAAGASSSTVTITTWSANTSTWEVTLTTSANHNLGVGATFTLSGLTFDWEATFGGEPIDRLDWSAWNGEQTTKTGTTGSTIVFDASSLPNWTAWIDQYKTLGYIGDPGGLSLDRSTGADHGDSLRAVAFHAGRVFYGGMINTEFNDYIMFSQVADGEEKYGKCYQEADPTDENFNSLTPADGGYIVIPGMGGVLNLVTVRNSLIVLSTNGIWEISGSRGGFFTADEYTVRKITETPAVGADAFVAVEDSLLFGSPDGLYIIAPNQYTGILESQSISERTIQTLWNDIPEAEQKRMQFKYDSSIKRVYMMYGPNGTSFAIDTMLIFDVKAGAFFKYTFDTPTNNVLLTGESIGNADTTSNNEKMKFIYEVSTTSVQVADFNQTGFDDWDGTNGPLPYMVFGDDNVGDWQRRRQAPIITVYSKRTNTGYTLSGGEYIEDNPASTLMTPFWDWTDETQWQTTAKTTQEDWDGTIYTTSPSVSGKIGRQVQVHRDVRNYVAGSTGDVDGYPVVVTRNKIRGRGRSLRLRFDGEADKDSHVLGYTVNYKVSRRK